ncbi:hypothetical protein ACJRO7_010379 [Eucalyptus globulus]|uniref:DUF4220 domain-containing protein n=1 Tax=Eucalyptus globulus TaxID=34317 RepID=A0ABD3LBU6_EUCGL
MVSFALAVQIILILFGHKRRSSHNLKLKIAVWLAYLIGDSIATITLRVLSNKLKEVNKTNGGRLGNDDKLFTFWSPLLLILLEEESVEETTNFFFAQ